MLDLSSAAPPRRSALLSALCAALFAATTGCGGRYEAASAPSHAYAAEAAPAPPSIATAGVPAIAAEPSTLDFEAASDGAALKSSSAASPAAPSAGDSEGRAPAREVAESSTERAKDYLVYTADLELASYQVERALEQVERLARDAGGYLATRSQEQITVRVPRQAFRDVLARIELVGDVVQRQVSAHDVGDEYVDLESRLHSARTLRTRLEELLGRANVADAIQIEKEVGRITQEIERLEGKLRLLKDRIAYSTISVHIARMGAPNARREVRMPFGWLHRLGLQNLLDFHEGPK